MLGYNILTQSSLLTILLTLAILCRCFSDFSLVSLPWCFPRELIPAHKLFFPPFPFSFFFFETGPMYPRFVSNSQYSWRWLWIPSLLFPPHKCITMLNLCLVRDWTQRSMIARQALPQMRSICSFLSLPIKKETCLSSKYKVLHYGLLPLTKISVWYSATRIVCTTVCWNSLQESGIGWMIQRRIRGSGVHSRWILLEHRNNIIESISLIHREVRLESGR